MISKLGPLIILAGAAQHFANKSGKKKNKSIILDPKTGKEIKEEVKNREKEDDGYEYD